VTSVSFVPSVQYDSIKYIMISLLLNYQLLLHSLNICHVLVQFVFILINI
jgi:hypothetical protein